MTTRTDVDIARNAENILWWTGHWRGNEISIQVAAGCVTLSGEVAWEYQKRLAVHVLRELPGVYSILDSIVVNHAHGRQSENFADDSRTKPDLVSSSRWS